MAADVSVLVDVTRFSRVSEQQIARAAVNVPRSETLGDAQRKRDQAADVEKAEQLVAGAAFVVVLRAHPDAQRSRECEPLPFPRRARAEFDVRALRAAAVGLSVIAQLEGHESVGAKPARSRDF